MDNTELGMQEPESQKEPIPTGVTTPKVTNNSGVNGPFPTELNYWNWGAFSLTWIWGIFNNVYITLILFLISWIPIANLAFIIYLGIKGNELAWRNRKFASVQEFRDVQGAWNTWGKILFFVPVVLFILAIILSATFFFHNINQSKTTTPSSTCVPLTGGIYGSGDDPNAPKFSKCY